ncbi:MAG: response regulator [Rhodobacteraceae bacterium]|nr:response regulator [Paracoccaceae bacterium]
MSEQPINDPSRRPIWGLRQRLLLALTGVTVICASGLLYLTFSIRGEVANLVRTDLEDLHLQMTVFDADVYAFLAETTSDDEISLLQTDEIRLADMRDSFNGIASFIEEMNDNPVYGYLQEDARANAALTRLTEFRNRFYPVVNGPDVGFFVAMPELELASFMMPAQVQAVKLRTEQVLQTQREERRSKAAAALTGLRYLTLGFLALVALVVGTLMALYRASIRLARAESALRGRVEAIVSSAQDAVVVTDETGSILHFNTAAEDMFGFSKADISHRNAIDMLASEDGRSTLIKRMGDLARAARRGGHATFDRYVHSVRKSDGTSFPAELSTSVNLGDGGLFFVHFIRDISTRLANERELKAARDKALSGEQAKSNFLAVMSHEIRTPLNGLLGTLSLLEETRLDERQQGYLANMERAGQLLREHVDDVLDIARFEAGYKTEIVNTDLDALMAEVVENQIHVAAMRENDVSWRWVGEPAALIRTDPRLLRQVLINLVGNGVKFTHRGTVELLAEKTRDPSGQDMIELRVRDTGPGIAAEDQQRIFNDFERVDSSLTRKTSGTGLGLGIAQRMTEALDGTLGVTSRLSHGSTFWLRFPFDPADAPILPPPLNLQQLPYADVTPKRVLVVEDNEINIKVLEQMLISDGHHVTLARNGQVGVDAADQQRFDLILMDVSMPVMDGPTAIGRIRGQDGPNDKTDIIIVTAHVMSSEYERLASLGVDGYLTKPIDRADLRRILAGRYQWPERQEKKGSPKSIPNIDATQLADLLDGIGADRLTDLLDQFAAENDDFLVALAQPVPQKDLVMLAHRFAGSAAILGATELHRCLGDFEALAQSESPEAARMTHMEEILRLSRVTRDALQSWLHA